MHNLEAHNVETTSIKRWFNEHRIHVISRFTFNLTFIQQQDVVSTLCAWWEICLQFYKEGNFSDFLFAFLHANIISKKVST